MCRAKDLEQEIASTVASMKDNHEQANKELSSPDCYVLPAVAFLLGLTCHKSLPDPMKIIALSMSQFLPHK